MDERDLKIVKLLIENARMPKVKIAEELGITETAVRKRIIKLENAGVIVGYKAVINYKNANIAGSLTGVDVEAEKLWEVIEELRKIENVKSIWITTGDHMLMLEIIASSVDELLKIHRDIERIESVKRVCPSIVLDVLK